MREASWSRYDCCWRDPGRTNPPGPSGEPPGAKGEAPGPNGDPPGAMDLGISWLAASNGETPENS